jgi:uncharacterized membrane protein YdjX (TVP38/TMEM64 family)
MNKAVILRAVVAVLLILGAVAAWIYAPLNSADLDRYVERGRQLGAWGPVVLAVLYVPVTVLLIPASWVTLAGAFAFGVPRAFAAVSAGSTAGACLAFLLSRYLLRGWIEAKLAANPRFRALDRAVGEQGFRIVFLTRLSPLMPFGVLNYAFGATQITFGRYAIASWIGMLPGTLMYTYLGSAARQLTDIASGRAAAGPLSQSLFFVGLAATVAVTYQLTRIASKTLRGAVGDERP